MTSPAQRQIKLSALAKILGLEFKGEDKVVTGLNSLQEAGPSEISFFTNPKYAHLLKTSKACAILVSEDFAHQVPNALISSNPYMDFAKTGAFFAKKQGEFKGVSPKAHIDESAVLGKNCIVYPFAFIGPRAKIGDNCEIFPNVYIGEDSVLGDNCQILPNAVIMAEVYLGNNCVVKPGAVIGSEGFGFVRLNNEVQKIPQTGTVVLKDGVEIGANTCVDKAHIGTTSIDEDTKIDNLVQIAHNVNIGKQGLIISQVGIAGSARLGDRVTLAGQTGIAGHLNIGDDVTAAAQSGVPADIPAGTVGGGTPFMSRRAFSRYLVLAPKIPDLFRQVSTLEKKVQTLEKKSDDN